MWGRVVVKEPGCDPKPSLGGVGGEGLGRCVSATCSAAITMPFEADGGAGSERHVEKEDTSAADDAATVSVFLTLRAPHSAASGLQLECAICSAESGDGEGCLCGSLCSLSGPASNVKAALSLSHAAVVLHAEGSVPSGANRSCSRGRDRCLDLGIWGCSGALGRVPAGNAALDPTPAIPGAGMLLSVISSPGDKMLGHGLDMVLKMTGGAGVLPRVSSSPGVSWDGAAPVKDT